MPEIADGEARLVVTGPPYFPSDIEAELADMGTVRRRIEELEHQILDFAATLRPTWAECARILSTDSVLILQTRDVRLDKRLVAVEAIHRLHAESIGFRLYSRHEWRPTQESPRRRRDVTLSVERGQPRPTDPEVFLVMFRGDPPHGTPTAADVQLLASPLLLTPRGSLPRSHRHQAPLSVLEAFIRVYSAPGDLVVDPFAGGGSTLVAGIRLDRQVVGYEIDPASIEIIRTNLEQ